MLKQALSSLAVVVMTIAVPLALSGGQLTPEAFVVERASYRNWGFQVSRSARVFGRFRAQGGSGNDIRVFVIDEDEFENFRNGRDVRSYYSSGQVSSGQIDLRLRFGRYEIIFDNRIPPYSNKNITANIQLEED